MFQSLNRTDFNAVQPLHTDLVGLEISVTGNMVLQPDKTYQYIAGKQIETGDCFNVPPRCTLIIVSDALFCLLLHYTTALCTISPEFLVVDSGFVSDITADGAIIVNGATVRVNDPLGVFGVAQTVDPLFGADIANPSVRTSTGFPHCIPSASTSSWCTKGGNARTAVNLGTKVANEQAFLDLMVSSSGCCCSALRCCASLSIYACVHIDV